MLDLREFHKKKEEGPGMRPKHSKDLLDLRKIQVTPIPGCRGRGRGRGRGSLDLRKIQVTLEASAPTPPPPPPPTPPPTPPPSHLPHLPPPPPPPHLHLPLQVTLAKQGDYTEAQKVKVQGDGLEATEVERARQEREQQALGTEGKLLHRQEQVRLTQPYPYSKP